MLRVITAASMPSARNHVRLRRGAGFAQQRRERHAGPFAGARQAVDLLRREIGLVAFTAIDAAAVARAFHRANHRAAREAVQVVEGEDQRPIDHAVDQQRVLLRIDRGHAAVMALEVQIGRRDDAVEILERRQARRAALAERDALRALERRPRADVGASGPWTFVGSAGTFGRAAWSGFCPATGSAAPTIPAVPAAKMRRREMDFGRSMRPP